MNNNNNNIEEHPCAVTRCPKKTKNPRMFLSSFPVYLCEDHFDIPLILIDGKIQTYKIEKDNLKFLSL